MNRVIYRYLTVYDRDGRRHKKYLFIYLLCL